MKLKSSFYVLFILLIKISNFVIFSFYSPGSDATVRQAGTNVSEEPAVSIFRLEDRLYYPSSTSKMETACSLRHVATYPSNHTVPHTLQDSSLSWELEPHNLSLSLIIPSSTILQPVKRTSFITISGIFSPSKWSLNAFMQSHLPFQDFRISHHWLYLKSFHI
jgi:hypothetical protein